MVGEPGSSRHIGKPLASRDVTEQAHLLPGRGRRITLKNAVSHQYLNSIERRSSLRRSNTRNHAIASEREREKVK
jgi:hypothetical protein